MKAAFSRFFVVCVSSCLYLILCVTINITTFFLLINRSLQWHFLFGILKLSAGLSQASLFSIVILKCCFIYFWNSYYSLSMGTAFHFATFDDFSLICVYCNWYYLNVVGILSVAV